MKGETHHVARWDGKDGVNGIFPDFVLLTLPGASFRIPRGRSKTPRDTEDLGKEPLCQFQITFRYLASRGILNIHGIYLSLIKY
jgi:hypothetical protein